MSEYAPKDRSDRGLEGDFRVDATPPSAEGEDYLRNLNRALDLLVDDEASDQASAYPAPLVARRKEVRRTAVADLKAAAQSFADSAATADPGTLPSLAVAAEQRCGAVIERYRATLPKFGAVTNRVPARSGLEKDFRIDLEPTLALDPAQSAGIDAINAVLDFLVAGEAEDRAAKCPATLKTARQQGRVKAIERLRSEAELHCDGKTTPAQAEASAKTIKDEYPATRPAVIVSDAAAPRFQGEFQIDAPNYLPTREEQNYFNNLKKVIDCLARDERAVDPAANYSPEVIAARRKERARAAAELRSEAEDFSRGELDPEFAANNVLVIKGIYQGLRDRLVRSLFAVAVKTEPDPGAPPDSDPEAGLAIDVDIRLERDLPPPNDVASPEKQELFVQINKTSTVIKTVCQRIQDRAGRWFDRTFKKTLVDREALRAKRLLNEYTRKLAGIGRLGLEGPHTSLAKLALSELRNEFVAHEAGRIKNTYVRRLGVWSGLATLAFLLAYIIITNQPQDSNWAWWHGHKTFLLSAAGASIGTWVSFSIRQVQLSFDDLGMLEEDSLDPPLRVIFVVLLTLAACLLFWTAAINVEVGNLRTRQESFVSSGTVALLIGLFCGLSERALATAISGRAAAFVRGVAGG